MPEKVTSYFLCLQSLLNSIQDYYFFHLYATKLNLEWETLFLLLLKLSEGFGCTF